MKLSKLIKTFKSYLTRDKEEIKENEEEIKIIINNLYEKKASLKKKLKNCEKKSDEKKLEDKLKAVKKLIKKAEKEFI
ncbi:hypothetical protein [Arcobacter sp.]|uniref:hypothetical protein n=1 Tax=Arcobacter sp. TaxID=1872629 RepID=UPI003D0D9A82